MIAKGKSISGKAPRSVSSMYGKLDPVGESKCLNTEALLKTLYTNIGSNLNTLLQNFSKGDFVAVKNELDQNYDRLSITIRNNSKPEFLYYEIMRILMNKTLDGLKQCIFQYLNLIDTASKLEKCNEYKSILDDPEKLKDYIDKLSRRFFLLEAEPITIIKGTLKPQYAAYVSLYGFPESGIFESDKMGDILYKLENNLPMTPLA